MATKNLKKLLNKIYTQNKNLKPQRYVANWPKAVKYVNAKGLRIQFNNIFKPLFQQLWAEELEIYKAGGHVISGQLRKEMRGYVKYKAKKATKAELAAQAATKQNHKEQEEALPEG
jgi:hypothetical protein